MYIDRNGNVGFVDNAIVDRDGGEYESNFDTLSADWQAAPGPVTLTFAWSGGGDAKIPSTVFYFNYLDTTLTSDDTEYQPGDRVSFSGGQPGRHCGCQDVQHMPVGGAPVTVSLVDSNGNSLASANVQTDALGSFSGSLVAPADARHGQPQPSRLTRIPPSSWVTPTGTGRWKSNCNSPATCLLQRACR
jgi:hypothetical protein